MHACLTQSDTTIWPHELLYDLTPSCMPPHILKIKKGCVLIVLRNLDPNSGIVNGTRVRVTGIGKNIIQSTILTGPKAEQLYMIPRIKLHCLDSRVPIPFQRRQFPVRLAFAMTINKSQGQTLCRTGMYLPEPVFAHGQLYVGCSRVGDPDLLVVFVEKTKSQGIVA